MTLLEIAGKTKDIEKARLDLHDMGIRKDQHPVFDKGKYKLPSGLYKLSPEMKQICATFFMMLSFQMVMPQISGDVLMFKVARLLDLKVMATILYFKSFYPWWYTSYCLQM